MLKPENIAAIFGESDTITRADFEAKATELKLGDLSGGDYVAVGKYNADVAAAKEAGIASKAGEITTLQTQLSEKDAALKAFDGIDVDAVKKYPTEIADMKKDHAIALGLTKARALDLTSVLPHIAKDKITMGDDGTISGLDEQIADLTKNKSFLFDNGTFVKKVSTGAKTGAGGDGGDDVDEGKLREAMGVPKAK